MKGYRFFIPKTYKVDPNKESQILNRMDEAKVITF